MLCILLVIQQEISSAFLSIMTVLNDQDGLSHAVEAVGEQQHGPSSSTTATTTTITSSPYDPDALVGVASMMCQSLPVPNNNGGGGRGGGGIENGGDLSWSFIDKDKSKMASPLPVVKEEKAGKPIQLCERRTVRFNIMMVSF